MPPSASASPPVFYLFVISGCALSYELLLLRLFSQIQWHHFAYLAISLALLGYGASGAWLALIQQRWLRRVDFWLSCNGLAFAFTSLAAVVVVQQLPFNSLEILWDPRQWLWLTVIYLCLFLPFFFAANALVLALSYYRTAIARLYAANLLGAGFGVLVMVVLQFYASTMMLLTGLSLLICTAVLLRLLQLRAGASELLGCGLCFVLILMLPAELRPSPFKALSKQLLIPQSRVTLQRHSPTVTLSVVESELLPFRISHGISMLSPYPLPEQRALYFNGDGPVPINRWQGTGSVAHLTQQTSALAYWLLAHPSPEQATLSKVLLIGLAGGKLLQQAAWYRVQHADIVELDGQLIELMTNPLADYWGWPVLRAAATIYHGDARAFVERHPASYDLIQLPLTSTANAVGSGTQGTAANYLLTRQALDGLWQALSPRGMLSLTLPLDIPPRLSMKLLTSLTGLLTTRVETPANHLLLVRNWNTITVLLSRSALTPQQYRQASAFSHQHAFDLLAPAISTPLSIRAYHKLPQDYFGYALSELLSPRRQQFIASYKFNIETTTDDRPYFFHFFRWQHLPEFYALFQQGGLLLVEQAYPLLWGIIILSTLLGFALIIVPLVWLRRRQGRNSKVPPVNMPSSLPWLSYFLLLGIAFMLVEMTLIPGFILFLSQPMISTMVVVAALLVFAGLGSQLCSTLHLAGARHRRVIVMTVALLLVSYNYLLPVIFTSAGGWPLPLKLICSLLLLLPLGLVMGMPLPLGLQALGQHQSFWLPWAWGVNGCASVVSTSLGTLLALHLGHSTMLLLAATCYGLIMFLPLADNS